MFEMHAKIALLIKKKRLCMMRLAVACILPRATARYVPVALRPLVAGVGARVSTAGGHDPRAPARRRPVGLLLLLLAAAQPVLLVVALHDEALIRHRVPHRCPQACLTAMADGTRERREGEGDSRV